mmetsp:Transcript_30545/g.66015  ORF Transcript_30545/g.66015 Transcript_30545/m.66015 type:complete len:428 (+) Transcript_30545:694-1977(+)
MEAESVDLAAFNAARSSVNVVRSTPTIAGRSSTTTDKIRHTIIPSVDPSPLLPIRGGKYGKSTVQIPRVGYSLYKTPPEQASRCVSLALRCGVRHFDVGTLYQSNSEISKPFQQYLDNGFTGLEKKGYYKDETPELLAFLDATSLAADRHATQQTAGFLSKSITTPLDGSAGRRARRESLFVSHKLSNDEQSTDVVTVKRRVKAAIAESGVGYLDLASIHSPATDRERRLASYRALIELRDQGFVRAVGVCNYGVGPLGEIAEAMGEENYRNLPAVNQLELSPFNAHADVVRYCDANGIAVGCAAWSKLSGANGPEEGWARVADLAKSRGVTKAQLLVRWSLQKGYVCVPRSGSASKIERVAIAQNSYGEVNDLVEDVGDSTFSLSEDEMKMLDELDIGYKAGKLGRRDGWGDDDVVGPEWDPTEIV